MKTIALAATLTCAAVLVADARQPADIDAALVRVGERVAAFYARALNVMCTETSTVQPIGWNYSPEGIARTVESELRLEAVGSEAPGEVAMVRAVKKVNGRAPRESDLKDRAGCTDPGLRSPEPASFLLPGNRSRYEFTYAGTARERNRAVTIINFATVDRRSKVGLVEDASGHEDCFDWSGHMASQGRIRIDAETYDVVRVDQHLRGPVDVSVPVLIERRYRLPTWVTIVRDDLTVRYRMETFTEPDEMLLVPESIDTITLIRGGLQSTRRNQTFWNCKRFVTQGRVVE